MILHQRVRECVELFLPIVQYIANNKKEFHEYYNMVKSVKSLFYLDALTMTISETSISLWMLGGNVIIEKSTLYTPMRISPTILSHISHEMDCLYHGIGSLVKYLDPQNIIPFPCPPEVYFQKSTVCDLFELDVYEDLIHMVRAVIPEGVCVSFNLGVDADQTVFPKDSMIPNIIDNLRRIVYEVTNA